MSVSYVGMQFHKDVPLPHIKNKETLIAFIGEPFFSDNFMDYEYFFYLNKKYIYVYILFKNQIVETKLVDIR